MSGRGPSLSYRDGAADALPHEKVAVSISQRHAAAAKLLAHKTGLDLPRYLGELVECVIEDRVEDVGGVKLGPLFGAVKAAAAAGGGR